MIKYFTVSLLLSSLTFAAPIVKSASNELAVKAKGNAIEVQLPQSAFRELKKWNPEFVIFSKTDYSPSVLEMFKEMNNTLLPMAFIDDLDGNGKKDIVLLGSDIKNQFAIALLQHDKKWVLVKLAEWTIKDIKQTVITSSASATTTKETGVPIYVLPALGEQAEKLKAKKKIGIQVERFMGDGEVYEIVNDQAVKFTL